MAPLIISIDPLPDDVVLAADGDVAQRLDEAHGVAVEAARVRVASRTSIAIDDDDLTRLGGLGGYRPPPDWPAGLINMLARPSGSESSTAAPAKPALVTGQTRRELSADACAPHLLMPELDAGWMLVIADPAGLDTSVIELLADLRMAFGSASATLFYGIRSALGPPPSSVEHPRLLVQLVGERSVLVQGAEHPTEQQHRIQPGHVLFVPRGRAATHLPLDLDSVHLEIELPTMAASFAETVTVEERVARCRRPVDLDGDLAAARLALRGASPVASAFRLAAPGGMHVVAAGDATDAAHTIAVADRQLHVTANGLELLIRLTEGHALVGKDLADELGIAVEQVDDALDHLWSAGVLAPVAPAVGTPVNDRLTQVASGAMDPSLVDAVVAAINPSGWRSPHSGEVPQVPGLQIDVQPVGDGLAPIVGQIAQIVQSMNGQFFDADLVGARVDDPVLLVRVGNGTPAGVESALASELLPPFSTRKVTWVLALNDADGGWPEVPAGSPVSADTAGSLSAWLSLRPWSITPSVDGERLFLLGRQHGPAFR